MTEPPQGNVPATISHYRLGALIGSGGMGMVYAATDRRTDVRVAIKLLRPELVGDRSFIDRFEREAHLGALLRSPYTAGLLEYGSDQGLIYIVMEYVEGQPLRGLLSQGPLEVKRALRIAVQIARALEEAEARGVVHRDIKPDNVMVRANDSVKVLDFGIARQISGGTLTMPGGFVGTLSYAAPEQALGHADHRSDIYAVGATLYHMVAGRPPFVGSLIEILGQQRERPMPIEPLQGLPGNVVELLQKALERDPQARFQSASELAVAIEKAGRLSQVPQIDTHTAVVEAAQADLLPETEAPAAALSPGIVGEPTARPLESEAAVDEATFIPTPAPPPARSPQIGSDEPTDIAPFATPTPPPAQPRQIAAEEPTDIAPLETPTPRGPSRAAPQPAQAQRKSGRGVLYAILGIGAGGAIAAAAFFLVGGGGNGESPPANNGDGETVGQQDPTATATAEPDGTADVVVPTVGEGDSVVRAISAGGEHSLWLHDDGTVSAWGDDRFGQLGDGQGSVTPEQCAGFPCSTGPITVPGLGGVASVSAGYRHSLALLDDGTVMAWGIDTVGQLGDGPNSVEECTSGDGTFACSTTPVQVGGLTGVSAVSAGGLHSLALLADGTVATWGDDGFGQLAHGSAPDQCGAVPCSSTPEIIPGLTDVVAIAAGFGHSLAVRSDGTVVAWGWDQHGQLGDGDGSAAQCANGPCAPTPVEVSGLANVSNVAAGGGHSLALLDDGTVMAWGWDAFGQLGDGPDVVGSCGGLACSPLPVQVPGVDDAVAIGAGGGGSVALLGDGIVVAWGEDAAGQVGDGPDSAAACDDTPDCSPSPTAVTGLAGVTQVAAGDDHMLALVDGNALAWGDDSSGKLGNGSTEEERCTDVREVDCSTTPTPVG
ncbi:MAG: protein kinase [Dehalococcoidia bacterium]